MKGYGLFRCFFYKLAFLFSLVIAASIMFAQESELDSLVKYYSTLPQGKQRVSLAVNICSQYIRVNKDSCRTFGLAALNEAKLHELPADEAMASFYLGKLYFNHNQYDSSRQFLQQAILISEQLPNFEEDRALMATALARTYHHQGLFSPALEKFQQALELTDAVLTNNPTTSNVNRELTLARKASIYNDLGIMYSDIKNYEKSREYFVRNLEMQLALNQTEDLPFSYNNIGYINLILGCYEEAIPYVRKSFNLRPPKDTCGQMYPIFNLGYIYAEQLQHDSAHHYLDIALNRSISCRSVHIELLSRIKMAKMQISKGQFNLAETNLLRAYHLSVSDQQRLERIDILEALTGLYKNTHKPLKEIKYLKAYHAAKDSLFNEKNVKRLTQQEAAFAYKQEKRQLEIKQQQTRLQFEADLDKQRSIKWGILGALFVAIAFLAVLQWYYRIKQRLVVELKKKNQQIITTQNQLVMQKKLAHLGQLTAGIAHEIKNPLNFINNFAEGSSDLISELEEELKKSESKIPVEGYRNIIEIVEEIKKNSNDIHYHGQRTDKIINSMMDHSRGGESKKQYVNINQLLDDNLDLAYHGLRALNPKMSVHVEKRYAADLFMVLAYPDELGRVFLNLINNSYQALKQKHEEHGTDPNFKPTITVSTQSRVSSNDASSEIVEIRIRDNGIGVPLKNRDKIFEPFFTTSKAGIGNTGLGLSISYDIIVNGHQGGLFLLTEEGSFTEFLIELPIG